MQYFSTNNQEVTATLKEAVIRGLAPDRGLYMPQEIRPLEREFFDKIETLTFQEIAFQVAKRFFGDDIAADDLREIVFDTLSFDCPIEKVEPNIYALELFHGPTLAFKDVGARFMARLLRHFLKQDSRTDVVNVLVATSGDTGSAVANGFLGVGGIRVFVLYPKGKVSPTQESQFATLGRNITAVEVDGVFDDCQRLVKTAFLDRQLQQAMYLTSANSINVARFLPQAFYYFNAYARLKREDRAGNVVVSVPSGNFGNITAGLFAQQMGLPIKRFIAANNRNDVFFEYLRTGEYHPKPSVQTVANAMDVGDPSNFARILSLFHSSHKEITEHISGFTYGDEKIMDTMRKCLSENNYLLDPHGACGYQALKDGLRQGETGVFLETAHPAKFSSVVKRATGSEAQVPERLAAFMKREKKNVPIGNSFAEFKALLLSMA